MTASIAANLNDAALEGHRRAYAEAQRAKRLSAVLGAAVLAVCILLAGWMGEVDLPRFFSNIDRFGNYIGDLMPVLRFESFWADLREWYWGFGYWMGKIGETLLIAYLGTVIGGSFALVLCFFAAANVTPARWVLFATRRFLEFCRTVPELVFALIFVIAFGLGPLPGVLALAIHTIGALGKLFSEVVENIDMKPVEGVTSSGGTWAQAMRFAAMPQVMSNFVSYGLLRFEINVRGAAIMGFVGAGGIGQDLITSIRKFYYADVSAILLLIVATVIIIDLVTERIRHRLIGMERTT